MSEPSALDSVARRKTAAAPAAAASASTSALDRVAKRKQTTAAQLPVIAPEAAPTLLDRIKALLLPAQDLATDPARRTDVAIGAGKGLVQDLVGLPDVLLQGANPLAAVATMLGKGPGITDRVEQVHPGARQTFEEDTAPANTDQMVGRVAELLGQIVGPAAVKGGATVGRAVGNLRTSRAAARAVSDTMADLAKGRATRTGTGWSPTPIPTDTPAPTLPTGTAARPFSMPGQPPRPPSPLAKTSGTGWTPAAIPEAGAAPAGPTGSTAHPFSMQVPASPPSPLAPLGTTSGTAMTAGPMPTEPLAWAVRVPAKAETAPVVTQAVQKLQAVVADAPAPVVTPPTPGAPVTAPAAADPLQAFASMMADKGAKVDAVLTETANTAGPAAAAEAFEETIRGELARIVKDARTRLGGDRAGDLLYGNSKRKGLLGLPEGTVPRPARRMSIDALDPSPSRTPQIVEEAKAAKAARESQKGISTLLATTTLGGAGVGALVGGTQGDTDEDRVTNAVLGGAVGAITVPLIVHAAVTRSPKKMQGFLYSSVLSSPQSVAKAYLGAMGGTIDAAVEQIATGNVRAGTRILTTLFHGQSARTFLQALKRPDTAALSGVAADAPSALGRIFGAGDAVARRAMAAGGIGADEAARYTLSGAPTSPMGKDILALYGKWFPLRLVSTMFPRVGIQVLERGLERLPLGTAIPKKLGVSSGTVGAQRARQVLGTVAGLGSYAGNEQIPDWAKPYLVAMAGVYSLPVGIGTAVAEAQSRGKGLGPTIADSMNVFAANMPFPQYGPLQQIRPETVASQFVPNLLRDIARARDPHERETSGQFLGRMRAKIPGLRETLPVQGQPVNIAGRPNQDRSSALTRALTPAPFQSTPMQDIPTPVAQELRRLKVSVNVPALALQGKVGKFDLKSLPVDPAVLEQARATRRQYLIPQIEKLLASPSYQRADDAAKKRRLAAVVERAQQAGATKARAQVVRLLRQQGALK